MNSSTHSGDVAVLGAIGCAVAVGLVLWLWGGLAGALFGSGWPHVDAGQLPSVLIRLPTRLGNPASAWPPLARVRLPGAFGCYVALALVGVVAFGISVVAGRARSLSAGGAGRGDGARWAGPRDLRQLRRGFAGPRMPANRGAEGSRAGRLTLGRHHGHLLHAEERHALVAFGPPQSGKSAGLAVPALLEWHGPAVASSIKTDLLDATLRRRRALGDVLVFDPFELSATESQTWSPLHAARTWDGALEVAWRLASAGEVDQRGVEGGDFWGIAAEQRLAPLLYAAAGTERDMGDVVRWAYGQGTRELDAALNELTGTARGEDALHDAHAAYDAVRAFETQADRTRTSIEATVQALLRAYRFARVLRSARSSEITADRLLDGDRTLYLIGDAKASKLLRPIFLALLSEVVDRAYERATRNGGRLDRPLLLCLDEAGNVAPLPNLAEIASTAPSHNIQLISIFHDLAQARSRYAGQAETVVNSHRARMLLPGVADLETLRYFSGLVGEQDAPDHSRTTGAGGATSSFSRRRRPLIAPEELRQLPDRHALLLYGRLAPAKIRLRLWFEDRRLKQLGGSE
jgi:type IV secretory pathway TraG/TraD family ATPase VirD4